MLNMTTALSPWAVPGVPERQVGRSRGIGLPAQFLPGDKGAFDRVDTVEQGFQAAV